MKHTPGPKLVIWYNRNKGFGQYESKQGPIFFTAYDCKEGVIPRAGQLVNIRSTPKVTLGDAGLALAEKICSLPGGDE